MTSAERIREHMEVTGSDGQHVGTVDCVENGEIILAKSDPESDGRHHSIPLDWVVSVESDEVRLNKLASEAQAEWAETNACP